MTQLSPAAQAVKDAFRGPWWLEESYPPEPVRLAAAFRAAADYAEKGISTASPSNEWGDGWMEGVRNTASGLRAIAAELEAAHG